MQNCGKTTFKRTSIDRLMNVLVLCVRPQPYLSDLRTNTVYFSAYRNFSSANVCVLMTRRKFPAAATMFALEYTDPGGAPGVRCGSLLFFCCGRSLRAELTRCSQVIDFPVERFVDEFMKRSLLTLRHLSLQIFVFLGFMCTVLAVGNSIWENNQGSNFTVFLPRQDGNSAAFTAFLTFWSYVIILNTVVPISLYVR